MSYVQLLIHTVVRTYKSEPTLPTDEKIKFLYREMWGIIKNINQQEHHKTVNFKDEYKAFIGEMGQEFDERDWSR